MLSLSPYNIKKVIKFYDVCNVYFESRRLAFKELFFKLRTTNLSFILIFIGNLSLTNFISIHKIKFNYLK